MSDTNGFASAVARGPHCLRHGVGPKFRRLGVAEMLVLRVMEEGMVKAGFAAELIMTLENNVMINRFLEAIGAVPYKTYRIYNRGLEGEKPTA